MASNIEGEEYIRKINGEAANPGGSGSNNNGKSNRGDNGGTSNAEAGDPMDLDTMRLAVNKLDPAERSRRLAEGRCLHCGKKGHLMRDCRSRARTNGRGGRGGGGRGDNSQGQQRGGGQTQPQGGTPAQFPGYGGYPQTTPASFGFPQQPYGQFNQPYGGFPAAPPRRGGYQGGPQLCYVNVPNPGFPMKIATGSDGYSQSGYDQATGSGTGTPHTGFYMPEGNNHSENE
jgi:hypothetical protein